MLITKIGLYNLCNVTFLRILNFNVRYESKVSDRICYLKIQLSKANRPILKAHKILPTKKSNQNKKAISLLLQKHGIKTSGLKNDHKIFTHSIWTIEKRIMLLQELGVPEIIPSYIIKIDKGMCLPNHLFKANTLINNDAKISENLLNSVIQSKSHYTNIYESPNITVKRIYANSLIHYLKHEQQFSYSQIHFIHKKAKWLWHNSFRLIKEVLIFLKSDLHLSNAKIASNFWILNSHPTKMKTIYKEIYKDFKEDSYKIILSSPRILNLELHNLQKIMRILKKYSITTDMVLLYPLIFQSNPDDLERKIKAIINNPLTRVFHKHPRFLELVIYYFSVFPRLQYLKDSQVRFLTIHGLTNKRGFSNLINSIKFKLRKNYLFYFLEKEFEYDVKTLLKIIEKHPFWMYVPLIQMYESLSYLRETFNENVIREHVYAILYKKQDIEAELNTSRPEYNYLSKSEQLGFIVYNIEKKCNFTGAIVLCINTDEIRNMKKSSYDIEMTL